MPKGGRLPFLDPSYDGQREKLLGYLRKGVPQSTAIVAAGFGRSTVLRAIAHGKRKKFRGKKDGSTWQDFHDFRAEYVQARCEGLASLHEAVVNGALGVTKTVTGKDGKTRTKVVQRANPALALRLLARIDPVNYNPEVMVRWAAIEAGVEDEASKLRARAGVTVRREKKP